MKTKKTYAQPAQPIEKIEVAFELSHKPKREVIYVLQGGGALGAYQVGAFEALNEYGYAPDMVVGISIGSINAAIIAGNKPEDRLKKLYQFWDTITTKVKFPSFHNLGLSKIHHWLSANYTMINGQPGFFAPRPVSPWIYPELEIEQMSYYDTTALRETIAKVVDFNYLNQSHVRLCLGAVDLSSGEFEFFDNKIQEITIEHIMASGALPPGFAPVEIDGRYYIDGGVYSNTPLSKVIDEFAESEDQIQNVLCFMIDLFSAKGPLPHSMDGMLERVKDIQYSSHTKRSNALYATTQNLSHAINFLAGKLTPEQRKDPKIQQIMKLGFAHRLDIIHLIYHSEKGSELHSKDYEFSVESANKHRDTGYNNTKRMIQSEEQEWLKHHRLGVTLYTTECETTTSHKL